MIVAIVKIPMTGPKRANAEVTKQSVDATKLIRDVKGLRRKYFLNNEQGGGGVYEFSTRSDADTFFNANWEFWMISRFGVRPTLEIFDNSVILDNEKSEVRVDGQVLDVAKG